eukprot:PhM_4_TR15699/c0_g1_i5/m.54578
MSMELGDFLAAAMGFNPNEEPTPKDMRDDMFIKGYPRKSFDADGLTPFRVELPPIANTMAPKTAFWPKDLATIRRVIPVHSVQMDSFRRIATAHVATPYVTSEGESECRTLLTTVLAAMLLRREDLRSAFAYLSSELKDKKNKYVGRAAVSSVLTLSGPEIEERNHVVTVGAGEEMYFVGCPPNVHMARADKLFLSHGKTEEVREEIRAALQNDVDPSGTVSLEVLDMSEALKGPVVGKSGAKKRRIESCTGARVWITPNHGSSYVFGGEEEREYVKFFVLAMKKLADRAAVDNSDVDAARSMASMLMRTSSFCVPSVSLPMMVGSGRSALLSLESDFNVMFLENIMDGVEEVAASGHPAKGMFLMGSSLGRWRAAMSILRRLSCTPRHDHYAALIKNLTTSSVDPDDEALGFGAELHRVAFFKPFIVHTRNLISRYRLAADVAAEIISDEQALIIGRRAYRDLFKWLADHRTAVRMDHNVVTTVVRAADIASQVFLTALPWPKGAVPVQTDMFADIDNPLFKEIDKVQTETSTCFVLVGDSTDGPFLGF